MKKLFNSRFLFILASSLVVLILLVLGAFYLFDENDDVFVKSGYVLNPLSSTTEKYFFDENVGYKENLSSMVEFRDVDENVVTILKDSFIHYLDDSMSFLKNGAILDLDSVNGDNAVAFYNITKDSIIEKKDNGYVIESKNGDIKLNNFIGRISDNKYMVVGDLNLKMAGNSTMIKGDYFEIVYVEEGIINIENKTVKYQVTAEDTLIYVGNDKVIDFGDKKLTVNDEDIMSITSITIDGNENIEIVPKAPEEDGANGGGSGGGTGTGTGDGTGSGSGSGSGTGSGSGDGSGDGTGDGSGNGSGTEGDGSGDGTGSGGGTGSGSGGTGNEGVDGEETDELKITLKDWKASSTRIDVTFDIVNASDDDSFVLQVINLSSGRTVDMFGNADVKIDKLIPVKNLSQDTKYLFTVVNKKDNGKYFQKILETTGFEIELEKNYATDSSLGFRVSVGDYTDIKSTKLILQEFDEEKGELVPVMVSYTDDSGNLVEVPKEFVISNEDDSNLSGVYEYEFTGLVHNTVYTASLIDFRNAEGNYTDIYSESESALTLKKEPKVDELIYDKAVSGESFSLSLKGITDDDNAITGYTYRIYKRVEEKNEDGEIELKEIEIDRFPSTDASLKEIKVGNGGKLEYDVQYYFDVVIEWFDNEKYVEYVAPKSEIFTMESTPHIEVVGNVIGHDSFVATIYLNDNSCLVPIPGRTGCDTVSENAPEVQILEVSSSGKVPITSFEPPKFTDEDGNGEYQATLNVYKLSMGTTYEIHVYSKLRNSITGAKEEIFPIEGTNANITTKFLTPFKVEWDDLDSSSNHVVNVFSKFVAEEYQGALSGDESAAAIKKVTISLFDGNDVNNLNEKTLIATKNFYNSPDDGFNIKKEFYEDGYTITTDGTFNDDTYFDDILGISVEDLKAWAYEKYGVDSLNDYYTVMINAYYDTEGKREVNLDEKFHPYEINDTIDMELVEPIVELQSRTNLVSKELKEISFANLDDDTIVGYEVYSWFDRDGLLAENKRSEEISFYVYNSNGESVSFSVKDKNDDLILIDEKDDKGEYKYTVTLEDGQTDYTLWIYMDYGKTSYESADDVMRRGDTYYIGYVVKTVDEDGHIQPYPTSSNPEELPPNVNVGLYKLTEFVEREEPEIGMYISKSNKDSISYRYVIDDPDGAIYREKDTLEYSFYSIINDGEEKKIDLTKVDSEYPKFEGEFTISNLKYNDIYSISYKKYFMKSYDENGELSIEFTNTPIYAGVGDTTGRRLFEGYYDASDNKYNFKYQIMPNPNGDNKVVIKMLPTEDILSRILSYKFTITDSKEHEWKFEDWKLSSCEGDSPEDTPRCYSIGYAELKDRGMKTPKDDAPNLIKIDIQAVYDTGIVDFDSIKKNNSGNEYYCILQENNTELSLGSYVAFTSGGNLGVWGNTVTDAPKGYGKCSLNGSMLTYTTYTEQLEKNFSKPFNIRLGESGYYTLGLKVDRNERTVVNPKMVAVQDMKSDKNTVSFSSITPKIKVSEKSSLLNGSIQSITFDGGIDLDDFKNEGTKDAPKYNLYIEIWDDESLVGDLSKIVRPTVIVPIDEKDTGKTLEAYIDGLNANSTYYFNVYADMYKDNVVKRTQLFDSATSDGNANRVATYNFTSMAPNGDYGLFNSFDFNYVSLTAPYGDRELRTNIILNLYDNGVPFNFDILYLFCDTAEGSECDLENDKKIFKDRILKDEFLIKNEWTQNHNISEYDLEFGKNYKMYIYAMIEVYQDGKNKIEVPVMLNDGLSKEKNLRALTMPSFTATREAGLDSDGKPYIDFVVTNVKDSDRTLLDGNYFVKLVDSNNNVVGTMQQIDQEGNVVRSLSSSDYYKEPFSATAVNGETLIRITDIDLDTLYTFVIFSEAYINNVGVPSDNRNQVVEKTYAVYSVNNYGVSFGRGEDIQYSGRDAKVSITFFGASNFENITEIIYNIYHYENGVRTPVADGFYTRGVDRDFEMSTETDEKQFILGPFYDDNGKDIFIDKHNYDVVLSFKGVIPETNEEFTLTEAENPAFFGRFEYGALVNPRN